MGPKFPFAGVRGGALAPPRWRRHPSARASESRVPLKVAHGEVMPLQPWPAYRSSPLGGKTSGNEATPPRALCVTARGQGPNSRQIPRAPTFLSKAHRCSRPDRDVWSIPGGDGRIEDASFDAVQVWARGFPAQPVRPRRPDGAPTAAIVTTESATPR